MEAKKVGKTAAKVVDMAEVKKAKAEKAKAVSKAAKTEQVAKTETKAEAKATKAVKAVKAEADKVAAKAKTAAKAEKVAKVEKAGYKNHRDGSRKGEVRKVFDEKGREKAMAFGKTQKLKESTLKQWMNTWARETAA